MKNITWHHTTISTNQRYKNINQKPFLLWFTGLSASGKSSIANLVDVKLFKSKYKTYILDGDNIRLGLNNDLGFDDKSRVENIRRIGEVSKLFLDAGIIVLSAFISPFQSDRDLVRNLFQEGQFLEIFIDSSLDVCEKRDPKGIYAKARKGEIKNFTGIDSPYESPKKPDIHILNDNISIEEAADQIIEFLISNKYIDM
tara:strand:+ start:392 stop:988 length:597 start_codon:yes stop_codon:yes gene_type:complete